MMDWFSDNHFSMLFYILAEFTVFVITLIFFPRSLRGFRRKTVTTLLSGHICPHCGYSLLRLPYREDGCTLCPECGVAWQLPELTAKPPVKWFGFRFAISCLTILSFTVFIILSIAFGDSILSSTVVLVFVNLIFISFVTFLFWSSNRADHPYLVIPIYRGLERGHCPACHVVLDGVAVDWDGVTTCGVCGAVWKVPDFAAEYKFPEATKFGRACIVPTWVVDEKGKSAMRLRAKNGWMEFIITSLMKKRCPGCSCSLAGVVADDKGMTRCPECEAVWVLPWDEDIDCYDG